MKTDPTLWLLARASGMTAFVLVTASVLAGLTLKARPLGTRVRSVTVTEVHRSLALSGLLLVAVHGAALVADRASGLSLPDLVVPGLSSYRPLATALGVLAAEALVVVYASFGLRKRIGTARWRSLHRLSFAVFAAAAAHGILAGTDTGAPWAQGLYAGAVGAVAAATAWRVLAPPVPARRSGRTLRT